ncbi:hypothetical protein PG987_007542 [Apiospora arundinis]
MGRRQSRFAEEGEGGHTDALQCRSTYLYGRERRERQRGTFQADYGGSWAQTWCEHGRRRGLKHYCSDPAHRITSRTESAYNTVENSGIMRL